MDPPQYDAQMVAPLAIYAIASYLQHNCIDVIVVDPYVLYDKATSGKLELLIENENTIFAFSVNSFNWPATKNIISRLKKINPDIITIVGGIHASYYPRQILMHSECDIVCIGEAELGLAEIIKTLTNYNMSPSHLRELTGVAYRDNETIIVRPHTKNLDLSKQKPYVPAYEFAPKNQYHYLSLETSRGCTANCAFCSISYKNNWRCYQASGLTEYFELAVAALNTTGSHGFYFVDDCFTANVRRAIDIMQQLKTQGFANIPIGLEARINNLLNTDLLKTLSTQKLWLIQTGVECGYAEGIERINKKTTLENVMKVASLAKQFSINDAVMFSFIVGLPWENYNDCLKTIHFAAEIVEKYQISANISWHTLLPSYLWEIRREYGIPFDETIFNEDQWFLSKDYFHRTKPFLGVREYLKLESIIIQYCDAGVPLRGIQRHKKFFL